MTEVHTSKYSMPQIICYRKGVPSQTLPMKYSYLIRQALYQLMLINLAEAANADEREVPVTQEHLIERNDIEYLLRIFFQDEKKEGGS